MTELEVEIYNVEGPNIYRIEFNKRWEFKVCLPPMSISDIESLIEELNEQIESAKEHQKNDPFGLQIIGETQT